jgi:hypothetical protein
MTIPIRSQLLQSATYYIHLAVSYVNKTCRNPTFPEALFNISTSITTIGKDRLPEHGYAIREITQIQADKKIGAGMSLDIPAPQN